MARFAVLPDLDAALVKYLSEHPDLAPLHGGRVGTKLQSSETSLRIANLGGTPEWPWMARSEFQIEAWGGTQGQANTLARTVVAVIYDMAGPVSGGWIVAAHVTLMPFWQPDTPDGRPRYLCQVELTGSVEQ